MRVLVVRVLAIRNLALAPLTGVVNALLNLVVVALASRRGQFVDIAGYAVGASAIALSAVVVCGGTTLVYVNGVEAERAAVRSFRFAISTPLLFGSAVIVALTYRAFADLPWLAIIAGGIAVAFNSITELASVDMQRAERLREWLAAIALSRTFAILLVVTGALYPVAMVGAAVVLFGITFVRTRAPLRSVPARKWREVYSIRLLGLSIANVLVVRLPVLVAPLVAGAAVVGILSVLFTGQQAAAAVFTAGLYATMAARAGSSEKENQRLLDSERVFIAASAVASVAGIALAPSMLGLLGIEHQDANVWFALLACAVPLLCLNRAWQYRLMGDRRDGEALAIIAAVLLGSTTVLVIAVLLGSANLVAAAVLSGELVGLIYVACLSWRPHKVRSQIHA